MSTSPNLDPTELGIHQNLQFLTPFLIFLHLLTTEAVLSSFSLTADEPGMTSTGLPMFLNHLQRPLKPYASINSWLALEVIFSTFPSTPYD
jgi:hypothetical protein